MSEEDKADTVEEEQEKLRKKCTLNTYISEIIAYEVMTRSVSKAPCSVLPRAFRV